MSSSDNRRAALSAAAARYQKKHLRSFTVRCNRVYDADIIALLEHQPNVSGYLKAMLHDKAAEEGFGGLRRENPSPPINPAARAAESDFKQGDNDDRDSSQDS